MPFPIQEIPCVSLAASNAVLSGSRLPVKAIRLGRAILDLPL